MGYDRMLIVVNPASGRGRGLGTAQAVAGRLESRGVSVTTRHTRAPGDAERITREAAGDASSRPGCVVACGGDGTLQEVANALAKLAPTLGAACPALGLAPAGRCNDFSRALGVGRDPAAIADVLIEGQPVPIDLGKVNDRYFCTVATLGVDAEVSSFVDGMRMPLRGTPAYVYGALRVLARYRPYPLRLAGDFGVIERPVFLASTANTASYGGAIKIAPAAVPTDGLLDLCVIDRVSRLRAFMLLPIVLSGRHGSLRIVSFLRTRRLTIDAPRPLELWADGERVARTPVAIEAAPAALRVIVPHKVSG